MSSCGIFPIDMALAEKAARLSRRGHAGKALAAKLSGVMSARDANLLANIGRAEAVDQDAHLSADELAVLTALASEERSRRRRGEVSSPKAWMLTRQTGFSEAKIRRITKKRIGSDIVPWEDGRFGFLTHSRNGHIWLTAAGWCLVRTYEEASATAPAPSPMETPRGA